MDKVNILIVEDESLIALELAAGLERDGYSIAGVVDTAEEAAAVFEREVVDVVLMDIRIHGDRDGVDAALDLLQVRSVPIVYLSALTDTQTVARVKQTHPAAFLTKPYSMPNVRIAIELALSNFAVEREREGMAKVISVNGKGVTGHVERELVLQLEDNIYVKNNLQFVKIALQDILYLEADNNYVNLWTPERKLALRLSLSTLLEKIQCRKLVRIHRSYAVNIGRIASFSEADVWVGKMQLPLGRNYREEFLNRFYFK